MISFLFRIAVKSAIVQKYRFASLTLTIAVASTLLVVLSALYFNVESQLSLDLSGVPNMVVEPKKSIVATSRLTVDDVLALKSEEHFWRNNIANAVPIMLAEGEIGGKRVKIAGTCFEMNISRENESYTFGLVKFEGWSYRGEKPNEDSVIIGANIDVGKMGGEVRINVGGSGRMFKVAGILKSGSYWDNYIFLDLEVLREMTGKDGLDQILVSALIKPKDELAVKAELYGADSLNEEFEKWYCSPYASTIAYTIKEVIPHSEVRILRRITEVQEGIIKASSGVFAAMFVLTLIASITSIFSAEKMYVSSKKREYGVMATIGSSRLKVFLQLIVELSMASFLSGALSYLLSRAAVGFISASVFGVSFQANSALITASASAPFITSLLTLIFVKRDLERNVIEILR